ncbi:hypothetical protein VTN00DRAFT_6792 [Thermoascus crustaceus]|uniref:uncharacterized protein n=1 Tax=Thermoascus crustaceus TaxID=5088 RepID=UPI003742E168
MAAHEGPQLPVSGVPSAPPKVDEVQEYEKILRISDEIFSGTHPRLKVPQQFVRKVTPRTLQTPPVTNSQVTTAEPSGTSQSKEQQPTPSTTRPANAQAASSSLSDPPSTSAAAAPSRITMKPTSEIDPIFLTKSDDLVRAEIQLQRQRVERVLRDQLDQKRQEARQKASAQEAKPDFDVSNVLTKALEIVKPVPPPSDIHGANGNAAPSDSFDENSFYSSRAPDSPQHGDQQQPSPISERQVHPVDMEDMTADAPVDSRSDELQRFEPANPCGMDMERQAYTVADKRLPPQKQSQNGPAEAAADKYHQTREPVDAFEEPEYSPPGPDIPPAERRDTFNQKRPAANGRPADRGHNGRRSLSPANDVRVVRNHITSPAAPQPSRVSPLATAKVPSIQQQHRDSRQGYQVELPTGHDSARTSPEAPVQQSMPRKRRRVQEPRDRPRQVLARRPAVDSPEPYIKEEPVSPPPFADIPPTYGQSRPPQERPVYIDIASPRYTPVVDRREPPIREPAYEVDRYGRAYEPEGHVEPGIARTVSRLGSRRPMRDDRDLRRVASLHHARQPEYAREAVEPAPNVNPRSVRASSYAVVERPTQARYYDEPVPTYSRRYVPADEPPPSPRFREAYVDEEPPPRIMAPPRRRIVVDEHGNQYYETLPPKVQEMPPPPSRVTKVDPYAERAPLRTASVRAPSIAEDPYGDRRYVQEMAPPQTTYRRVTDYPGTTLERRPYARELDEREPVMRSGSVQVVDYPRHTTYIDERDLPRERLVRMSSVRPPPVARYEDPREGIQRVQSVRPGGREVSVYVDDEPRRPREYVERPVYAPARPVREERYYEDDDAGRMVLDGTRDVVHRMPQRY